jgi:hypothetical protein
MVMSWAILGKNRRNRQHSRATGKQWEGGRLLGSRDWQGIAEDSCLRVKRRWLNIVDVVGGGGTSD